MQNPLFEAKPILFMKRRRFICQMLHEYLGYYYDYADIDGGGISVLERPGYSLETTDLIGGQLPRGNYTTLSLSYDAGTIYFAFAERSAKNFAIVTIDMDEFKSVNDTYGHPIGDKVLINVARRLEKTIRGSDTCARIGGDEFAVIAEEIRNKGDVLRVMQKISSSLQGEVSIDNKMIHINASMGASIYPLHGKDMEKLFKAADKALYLVKGSKTRYKLYSDDQISWLKN